MRRILCLFFVSAWLFPWGAKAQTKTYELCVLFNDSVEITYSKEHLQQLYFVDTTSLVVVEGFSTDVRTYRLTDIRKIWFRETTGVAEACAVRPMTLYPNPAGDFIRIDRAEKACYVICDMSGRMWLRGKYQDRIDVSSLQSGAYVIRIGNQTLKFAKQ